LLELAIAGTFAASLEQPMRHHLNIPCNIVVSDEKGIIPLLGAADVLVTMGFTAAMGRAVTKLKLFRCPAQELTASTARRSLRGRGWQTSTATRPASPNMRSARCWH
jgi:hypothetical protein